MRAETGAGETGDEGEDGCRYGLPLSRLYARYFQGEVFLVSMDGYGTDAVVQLKALPMEAAEQLPIYSTSSRRQLTMKTQAGDWSQPTPNAFRSFSTSARRLATAAAGRPCLTSVGS